MPSSETVHILDNPVWEAMNSNLNRFTTGTTLAKRGPLSRGSIVALVDPSDLAVRDLEELVAKGETVVLMARNYPEFPGWTTQHQDTLFQMVSYQPVLQTDGPIRPAVLTESDMSDMARLVDLTRPGPLLPNALELGKFIGIRQQGDLVAMAGLDTRSRLSRNLHCLHPPRPPGQRICRSAG